MARLSKNQLGFSTLEIAIALAMLSVLVGASLVNFEELYWHRKLKYEATRLKAKLEELALTAQQFDSRASLSVYSSQYQWELGNAETKMTGLVSLNGVQLTSSRKTDNLEFYSSGSNTPATLYLSRGEKQCKITLSLRARVQLTCS